MADSPIQTGEVSGSATAKQLPNIKASMVKIKAASDNVGKVYVGAGTNVTKADGTSDTTGGFPLAAGEDTGWMQASNLNEFFIIGDNAGDDVIYLVMQP